MTPARDPDRPGVRARTDDRKLLRRRPLPAEHDPSPMSSADRTGMVAVHRRTWTDLAIYLGESRRASASSTAGASERAAIASTTTVAGKYAQ